MVMQNLCTFTYRSSVLVFLVQVKCEKIELWMEIPLPDLSFHSCRPYNKKPSLQPGSKFPSAKNINRNLYLKIMEVWAQDTFLQVHTRGELAIHCKVGAMDHEFHKEYCQVFAQLLSLNKQKVWPPKSVQKSKNENEMAGFQNFNEYLIITVH